MSIAIAQLRPAAATPEDNERNILAAIGSARRAGARLLVTSASALDGRFVADPARRPDPAPALRRLARQAKGIAVVVGVGAAPALSTAPRLALLQDGSARHDLHDCAAMGVAVLEAESLHHPQVVRAFRDVGARTLVVSAADPYVPGVHRQRERTLSHIARTFAVDLVWVNSLGAGGGRVYDGASLAVSADGRRWQQLPAWQPTLALLALDRESPVRGDISHDDGLHAYFALREALLARLAGGSGAAVTTELLDPGPASPADARDPHAASLSSAVIGDVRSLVAATSAHAADPRAAGEPWRLRLRVASSGEEALAVRTVGGELIVSIAEPLLRAAADFRASLGVVASGRDAPAMAVPAAVR